MDGYIIPANRVYQLASHNLDVEISKIIDAYVDNVELPILSDEAKLAAKLFLSAMTLRQSTTIGRKSYNLYLRESAQPYEQSELRHVGRRKLILMAVLDFILPYSLTKLSLRGRPLYSIYPWLTIENLTRQFRVLKILNFLIFLHQGRYLRLQERLLGIFSVVSSKDHRENMAINQVQMELLDRELLWKGLAEFFLTVAPFLNGRLITNKCSRILKAIFGERKIVTISDGIQQDPTSCSICKEQPFNPHTIGCSHVFCYYCIKTNYLVDATTYYKCPKCNYKTSNNKEVQRYYIYAALDSTS